MPRNDILVTRVTRSQEKKEKILSDKGDTNKPGTNQVPNKFFKSKTLRAAPKKRLMQRTMPKRATRLNQIKNDDSSEFVPSMKQPTLSESFARASVRGKLRPRKEVKNYCDASVLAKSISPDKRKSFVLLENIDFNKGTNKAPVYKSVKTTDKDSEGKESVYEFDFDVNDPKEKVNKGKKKRARRKAATVKKKKTDAKSVVEKLQEPLKEQTKVTEPSKSLTPEDEVGGNVVSLPVGGTVVETKEEGQKTTSVTEDGPCDLPTSKNVPLKSPQLRIAHVEKLTGDRKVSFKSNLSRTGQNSTKFNPFRSTISVFRQRPTLQTQEMMNHSLLNKSLSPIKNETDHFDPASPWRPPTTNELFSIKRMVQSTPQPRRITSTSSSVEFRRIHRILENNENRENVEPTRSSTSPVSRQGESKAVKPLGLRTLNAENIQAGPNISSDASRLGGTRPFTQSSNRAENKVNTGFGDRLYKSPSKNNKIMVGSGLRRKNQEVLRSVTHDDENLPLGEDAKFLKQSKLNSFLNMDEMPESTTINTSHGIFGDSIATPAISEQTLKIPRPVEIENCFGFEDDYSSTQVTPIKFDNKQDRTPVKKVFERPRGRVLSTEKGSSVKTARISLGEIKNTLYPRKETKIDNVETKNDKERKTELDINAIKDSRNQEADVRPTDASNTVKFTDTFDVLSESVQGQETDKSLDAEISLFADMEPVHFTKPPRRSYAKKRERVRYWSSEAEEDDEFENDVENPTRKKKKRQKLTKVAQVENKKIEEWVKSVNNTFREIDEFDLVVEKAP
ncbi:uncharacterized protein [Neodiprion pinetum]|uniref:uncharacterized protein n=1 Tax=Neodiprion pinetum TaxID=441929 RepID=UPI001EE1241E|nr:uncharacterized protein LOC124223788 [Neodiprion pinetum]XP_046492019.1 uncharacterized protein LOC124223788 [Neodiprion pinetum]